MKWSVIFGFIILFISSCDTDNEGTVYHPTGTEAYFASTVITQEMTGDENSFDLIINRGYFPGERTIEITANDTSSIFAIPATATFSGNEETAILKIGIHGELELGAKYAIDLAIDRKDASITKSETVRLEVVKYVWENLGSSVFSSEFFEGTWRQIVLKAKNTGVYRLPDCYSEGYNITFTIENGEVSEFANQATGYVHPVYGMVYVRLIDQLVRGNVVMLALNFYCSAGSFGTAVETIQIP